MALQLTKRRFTVSEYHQMAEAGILGEQRGIVCAAPRIAALPYVIHPQHVIPAQAGIQGSGVSGEHPIKLYPA